jgi:hypothetical protein
MDILFFEFPMAKAARLFQIVASVRYWQRRQPKGRGVLPVTVLTDIWDEAVAEQTIRRDCVTLWQMGILERVGAEGLNARTRRGYRLAVSA